MGLEQKNVEGGDGGGERREPPFHFLTRPYFPRLLLSPHFPRVLLAALYFVRLVWERERLLSRQVKWRLRILHKDRQAFQTISVRDICCSAINRILYPLEILYKNI